MFLGSLLLFSFINFVICGKPENLLGSIQQSKYNDVAVSGSTVFCKKCNVYLTFKTTNHFSNLLRYFRSDQHIDKAQWTVEENSDGTYKIKSKVQKTLFNFFKQSKNSGHTEVTSFHRPILQTPSPVPSHSLPTHSFLVKDILDKEGEKSHEQQMKISKSSQLTKSILADERLSLVSSGQQNLQFKEQIIASMEYLQTTFGEKVESLLSKLNYVGFVPSYFISNLYHFSTHIIVDLEKSESKQKEVIELTENFVIQRFHIISDIVQRKKSIQHEYTINGILSNVKDSGWHHNANYPEILLKLSILLEQDNFLSVFLKDILTNMEKRRPVWSEATLSMFSLLLNYGGPKTAELVSKIFGGPHLSSVYIKSRQLINVQTSFQPEAFLFAAKFYNQLLGNEKTLKDILFTIAVDATPVLPLVRAKGNCLVGFASSEKIEVSNAQDIINVFRNKELTTAQQVYVFILSPMRSDIPYFILAAPPVTKGENYNTVSLWMNNAVSWGERFGINVFGLGADGDSKVRSYYMKTFLKRQECQLRCYYQSTRFHIPFT